jgi:hypothetical protein
MPAIEDSKKKMKLTIEKYTKYLCNARRLVYTHLSNLPMVRILTDTSAAHFWKCKKTM